jgi:hypothetical protein
VDSVTSGGKVGEGDIYNEHVGKKRLRSRYESRSNTPDRDNALLSANKQVLSLQELTKQLVKEKAALTRWAEVAEASVLVSLHESRKHAEEKAAQSLRAETAEARALVMQHEADKNSQEKAAQEKRAETLEVQMRQEARKHVLEKAALQWQVMAADARALEMEREARRHAQERETQHHRAEEAEARLLEMQHKARDAEVVAAAVAADIPALMRAAEGMRGLVAETDLQELLALDGSWSAALETIRAELTRRARQAPIPDGFLCPITQALLSQPPRTLLDEV